MPSVHFHPVYAWSLVEDLINSKAISENQAQGYVQDKLQAGRSAGWINETTQQTARWMFVFANDVILPGEVDLMVSSDEPIINNLNGLHWGKNILEQDNRNSIRPEYDDLIDTTWAGLVSSYIVDESINLDDIAETISWWSRLRKFEASSILKTKSKEQWDMIDHSGLREAVANGRQSEHPLWKILNPKQKNGILNLLKFDPEKEAVRFQKIEQSVSSTLSFARSSLAFAKQGCPTLARTNHRSIGAIPQKLDEYEAIVRFYFQKVRLPAPENAKEALRFRENDRVIEWRGKIESWSSRLASGHLDLKSIQQEIDDASGYIEGAKGIRTSMSFVKPWVTYPLALALEFAPEFPGKRPAQLTLVTLEGIKHIVGAIHASATGNQPPSYGWLLVEPSAPAE